MYIKRLKSAGFSTSGAKPDSVRQIQGGGRRQGDEQGAKSFRYFGREKKGGLTWPLNEG